MKIWHRIIEPWYTPRSQQERRDARLLAALLLWLFAVSLLIILIYLTMGFYDPAGTRDAVRLLLSAQVLLFVSYVLSRTRYYRWGLAILMANVTGNTILGLYSGIGLEALYYLIIPVALGTIFLSLRTLLLLATLQITFMVAWVTLNPTTHLRDIHHVLAFNVAMFPVMMLTLHYRSRLEQQHELEVTREQMKAEILRVELEKEHQLNEMKDSFISAVSHEFRTPLAVILSSSEILQHYWERLTSEQRARYFDNVGRSVSHLTAMLEKVILLSKINSGHVTFKPEVVDPARWARAQIDQSSVNGRPIIIKADDVPGNVKIDLQLVGTILHELIANAVAYAPPDTPITLLVEKQDDDLCFGVQDEGPGIEPKDLPQIFESFYRGANASAIPGAGLGLTLAQQCALLHGGSITIASAPDSGTLARVSVPWIRAED